MSSKKDQLGDRMKRYENVPKLFLTRRTPVIIRLDGKAFHTFTKGFVRPFDKVLMQTMNDTMKYLCENIQGCVLGYTQSDEITLVLIDYQTLTTDAWFDNNVEKMCSISASMATLAFNTFWKQNVDNISPKFVAEDCLLKANGISYKQYQTYNSRCNKALFDSRVFNVPKEEVLNCLVWRQQDATRNSIQSVGQVYFSDKQLHKKTCNQIQDMLFTKKGINWNNYPISCKRGTCCIKKPVEVEERDKKGNAIGTKMRNKWVIDTEIPIFNKEPEYINSLIMIEN